MGRHDVALADVLLGPIRGAIASAGVGAVVGIALWVSGLGFAYHWLDWPIGGAFFGLVVGVVGGTVGVVFRLLARMTSRRGTLTSICSLGAVGAIPGATLGGYFGFSMHQFASETLIYGTFGAIGGAVGALASGRLTVADREKPSSSQGEPDT